MPREQHYAGFALEALSNIGNQDKKVPFKQALEALCAFEMDINTDPTPVSVSIYAVARYNC